MILLNCFIYLSDPHLFPAIEDSYNNSTPVLGKLLKVQTEVTPPPLHISPSPPVSTVSNVSYLLFLSKSTSYAIILNPR